MLNKWGEMWGEDMPRASTTSDWDWGDCLAHLIFKQNRTKRFSYLPSVQTQIHVLMFISTRQGPMRSYFACKSFYVVLRWLGCSGSVGSVARQETVTRVARGILERLASGEEEEATWPFACA